MAKHKYYLDTRVLTAFFFAAMPFVAFGSFIVVNMAKNQLRDSVGVGLEQRAVQTKLALERHIGEQVLELRLRRSRRPWAGPRRPSRPRRLVVSSRPGTPMGIRPSSSRASRGGFAT
jgi:hypothetical protein